MKAKTMLRKEAVLRINESTHYTVVENQDYAPSVNEGDTIFLKRLLPKEVYESITGSYMAIRKTGEKVFFRVFVMLTCYGC